MIRDVVLHLTNEQPLLADLWGVPSPGDVAMLCTNLRMMNGTRPVFVDRSDSVFLFPLVHLRFAEMPAGAARAILDGIDGDASWPDTVAGAAPGDGTGEPAPEPEPELELDEELLRRVRDL